MKITRLLLVLAAFATGVFAQPTPAPTPAAAPVDPAKLALAREVITVMKADRMFDAMAAQMKQSAASVTSLPPTATAEQRQKASELQDKIVSLSMEAAKGMVSRMDEVYADVYSVPELKAMKAFFSSSEGSSMLAKQPQIMAHVMPMVQEMQRTLIPKVQHLVEEAKLNEPASAPAPVPTPTPTAK